MHRRKDVEVRSQWCVDVRECRVFTKGPQTRRKLLSLLANSIIRYFCPVKARIAKVILSSRPKLARATEMRYREFNP